MDGVSHLPVLFCPPELSSRVRSKAEGGSHGHVRGCGLLTADMVETGQEKFGKRLREESLEEPLSFYCTNNMFDETKLYVAAPGGHRAKRRRTIAQGCEVTHKKPKGRVEDTHIVRPPALVVSCNAAACAAVVGNPKNPFGIAPDAETLPKAAFLRLSHIHRFPLGE